MVNDIGSRIVSGELRGDATIDPGGLIERYDVSRIVVREALKVLSGNGLVDARPNRGTFVQARDNWNLLDPDVLRWQFMIADNSDILEELHEVRVIVEPAAPALAAERRTDADLRVLDRALADMESSDAATAAIVGADQRFHRGLIDATHNELVVQLAFVIETGLAARDRYVHDHRVSIKRGLKRHRRRHRRVLEAVRSRRPAAARTAMNALLKVAASDVREVTHSAARKSTG